MKLITLPNIVTLINLALGIAGVYFAQNQELELASYCIIGALIADYFDGFVARMTQSFSELGKQLDSLADMVSFGVLPGFMLFHLNTGFDYSWFFFALALFSALRLAKFNIDPRQSEGFIGLPTPANALCIASFPFLINDFSFIAEHFGILSLIYTALMCYLLVSEIPMLSFKFKEFSWKKNKVRYLIMIISIVLLVPLRYAAIPLILLVYVASSFFVNLKKKQGELGQ